MATQPQTPDLTLIKNRQQKAWSSGDYGKVGVMLLILGESALAAMGLSKRHEVSAHLLPWGVGAVMGCCAGSSMR